MKASWFGGRLRAWATILVTAILLSACTKTDTEYLASAKQRYERGELVAAILDAKNALAKNPANGQARLLLGVLQNDAGNPKEAEQELRRAEKAGLVEGGRVQAELARALVADGQAKQVLSEIKPSDSFEAEPLAAIHALRGHAHLLTREKDNARKALEASRQSSPGHPQTALLEARIQISDGKYEDALATMDQLLKVKPRSVDALMMKADLLLVLKRGPEAVPVYDAILALRSGSVPVHLARALLMVQLGKLDEAQKDSDAIRRISRTVPAGLYLQALLFMKQGKLREAETAIQNALKMAPDYGAAQLLAGVIAHGRGSYVSAERILANFLNRNQFNLVARRLLAAARLELGKYREAFETLEPVLGDYMKNAEVLSLAGDILLAEGEIERAGRYYRRAAAAEPEDARIKTSLAVARLQGGETDQALSELEAIAQLGTAGDRADRILITTLQGRGEYDKALAAAQRLEKRQPKSAIPPHLSGMIQLSRKDVAAARKSFERALELDPRYFPAAARLAELDVQDKRPADAQRRFEQVLAKEPKNTSAMLSLARLATQAKDPATTVKWLEKARVANPSDVDVLGQLSSHYLGTGNIQKGLEDAQDAAARNPSAPAALDLLGTAQLANREFNAAAQSYARMARLAPKVPVVQYRLAAAQQAGGDNSGAEASLRKAVELDPKYLAAWIALAGVYINQGKAEPALKAATQVRQLAPKAPHSYVLEGEAHLLAKRYPDAERAYEAAFALEPSGSHAVKVYVARARGGNRAAAMAGLEKWVEANPQDPIARRVLADAYVADNRPNDAIGQYEKVVQITPKDPVVLNNLANAYISIKDARAVDTARRAHELMPGDPNLLDTYGWSLAENGKAKDALPLLEKAKGLSPRNGEISYHLAAALARSGDKGRAKKEVEALLQDKNSAYAKQAKALLDSL